MLIRNLFGGDVAAYSATIERLDSFTDLDDALLYMQENFEWDPDSEGVQLLVDLLERKRSSMWCPRRSATWTISRCAP